MSIEKVGASGARRCWAACRALDHAWGAWQTERVGDERRTAYFVGQAIVSLRIPAGPEPLPAFDISTRHDAIATAEFQSALAATFYEDHDLLNGRACARRALAVAIKFRSEID